MRRILILLLACATPLAVAQPPRAAVKNLEPASCGVRQTLWIRHYAAELFLPPGAPPTALTDPAAPKLLRLRIIDPSFMPPQVPAPWHDALAPLLDGETMRGLQAVYGTLRRGDVIVVTYDPTQGASLHLNDRLLAHAPGHAAVDALLAAWAVQGEPLDEQLMQTTARHPCG